MITIQERYERHVQFEQKKAAKEIAGVKKGASAAIDDAKSTIKHKEQVIKVSFIFPCLHSHENHALTSYSHSTSTDAT